MKMNKFFAMALPLCAGALLAGCSDAATEEEIAPAPAATTHSFTATILNDDTRAYVDGDDHYIVKWQEGDQMSYFTIGQTENPKVATLVEGYGGKEYGEFTYNDNQSTIGGGCYAIYPYNANDRIERHTIVTELPTEQTYKAGSHGGTNVFMTDYTVATDTNGSLDAIQVYNSYLGLWLKGRGTGFKIIIESKEEPLAGQVKIATPYMDKNGNYVDYPVAVATDQSSKVVTFTCDSELLADEAKPFCVALLPGKYTKLRIKVTNLDGTETYFNRTASNLTFHQGLIKMMDKKAVKALQLPMPIDHNLNPLRKWAEADLVYNKQAKSSSIASSYTVQGSLYQWGRNVGWSNYEDAMGDFNYKGTWNYATYLRPYKSATGGSTNGDDDESRIIYDNANAFAALPDIYFMDPNGTDYWRSSFGDGGSNWNERAKKCGFNGSPCPSGYHMPTKAEFLEIKPSGPLSGYGSLAQVLNNRVELRKIEGGCTYAMRWSAETKSNKTYLRIDALVVEEDFAEADLSTIDWNDENVVTRYFGANGYINGFYHVNMVDQFEFHVARPMPGTETHEDWLDQYQLNNGTTITTIFTVYWDYIIDYSVKNDGYYWMSDVKEALTFQDNTRVKTARKTYRGNPTDTYAFPDRLSVFGTLQTNAQNCCSIRCVED